MRIYDPFGIVKTGAPVTFANPTGTIGLSAVNGTALTAMRSDAAPALSQAIAPTWTALHIFSQIGTTSLAPSVSIASTLPILAFNETDATANNRLWGLQANSEQFRGVVCSDAGTQATWLLVERTANTVDEVNFFSALTTVSAAFSVAGVATFTDTATGQIVVRNSAAATDAKNTVLRSNGGGNFRIASATDAAPSTQVNTGLNFERTGIAFSAIGFGNTTDNPAFTFNGSGAVSFTGDITAAGRLLLTRTGSTLANAALAINATVNPSFVMNQSTGAANNRQWERVIDSEQLIERTVNDANNSVANWLVVDRTGTVVDSVSLPATAASAFRVGTTTAAGLSAIADFLGSVRGISVSNTDPTGESITAWNKSTTGNNVFVAFSTEAAYTVRGTISYNRGGGLVAYNTTSDRRLKKNIRDAGDAGSKIDAIQVRAFEWDDNKDDAKLDFWFVAQELADVVPYAVTRGDSGSKLTKDSQTWSIDPSKLIPLMVKELQSLRARLAALEAA